MGSVPARMFPAGPARFMPGYRFAAVQAAKSQQAIVRRWSLDAPDRPLWIPAA